MLKPIVDVSLSSLKQELRQAQELEAKKQNVNDSKMRAVSQHMDYDNFRQMVLGANLKCTKTGEINSIHSLSDERMLNAHYRVSAPCSAVGGETDLREEGIISTLKQFNSRWKTGADRWEVLKQTDLSSVFQRGIECDYVADVVNLAHAGLILGEFPCTLEDWSQIWRQVTQLQGFQQGLKFLMKKERAAYEQLTEMFESE